MTMFPELEPLAPVVLERLAPLALPPAEPGSVRILLGDVRARLRGMANQSVHVVATSPPYYGLRSYGTKPQVWGGACCEHEHEWEAEVIARGPSQRQGATSQRRGRTNTDEQIHRGRSQGQTCTHVHEWTQVEEVHNRGDDTAGAKQRSNNGSVTGRGVVSYGTCECGAWRGHLGLEPTLEMYVEHIVEVFRDVRRVLRDDGSVWLNLGDSYSSHDPGGYRPGEFLNPDGRQGPKAQTGARNRAGNYRPSGVKPKSLMMVPARVAIALEADGWYLRAQAPWVKANAMPDSASDRPGNAVEMVYLLSKKKHYFYDVEAVLVDGVDPGRIRRNERIGGANGHTVRHSEGGVIDGTQDTRYRRNSDWFFESWQGLVLDDDDLPLAFVVNPQPFPGAHFAVWPSKLVTPMVKASTSEKGVCSECGAPWERQTGRACVACGGFIPTQGNSCRACGHVNDWKAERGLSEDYGTLDWTTNGKATPRRLNASGKQATAGSSKSITLGWRPACKHYVSHDDRWSGPPVIPATVLDIFGGAGSTAIAASRLGRDAILIELNPEYAKLAADRIYEDGGFTVNIQIEGDVT